METISEDDQVNIKIQFPLVRNAAILGAVFFQLLIAKLAGWVGWSWWVITLPIWIMPAIYLIAFMVIVYLAVLRGVEKYTSTLFKRP